MATFGKQLQNASSSSVPVWFHRDTTIQQILDQHTNTRSATAVIDEALPGVRVEELSNEVLHVRLYENTIKSATFGFDEDLGRRHSYGSAVCMPSELCKASQDTYTGNGRSKCFIIAHKFRASPTWSQGQTLWC